MVLKIVKGLLTSSAYKYKMVFVVRTDIGLRSGKIAAQCCHAAILCYEKGQAKVVLKVNNLASLEEIYKQAKDSNITAELVRDAGHTQVTPGTITVLGIGPDTVEKVDSVTKHLKLL
ncbi:peptidyl-tRNA hydrolase 2, mitochondrial [Ctenocephalides felis]|uniref:peptidyl-tRNA hydrolase 2, mitochondrial n=1 Tax=Ctenocephalides felis TaxID=7515 RepID=UPI000E6E5B95|nr:peptidyl-tRNA hydrolase 2, mitochondrial [Ctenocephalides felis]